MRLAPLGLLALAVVASAWTPIARADDAGASTFRGGARRYAPAQFSEADVVVPTIEPKTAKAPSVPDYGPGEEAVKFPLQRFEVSGNTLLPPSKLEEVLAPFQKENATIADVQAARDALQKAYEDEGFLTVVVTLPQQTVAEGQVQLDVVENRLGKVTVSNDGVRWFSDDLVRRDTPHLVPGAILRREDLSADMQTANRNPDRQVRPLLRAGEQPGTADLALVVDDNIPLHGSLSYNNRYTAGSPPTRAIANLSYANLWGLEHTASVSYQFAPSSAFNEVQIYSATYAAPMPWNPEQSVFGYFVRSDTANAVTSAPGVGVSGKGLNAGFRGISPLPEIPGLVGFSHSVSFGADRKDIQNGLLAPGALILTPITYIPFSFSYNTNWITDQMFVNARLGLSFNFAGMTSGGSKQDFQINRGGISPLNPVDGTYQIFNWGLTWTVRIPGIRQILAAGRALVPEKPKVASFGDDWTLNLIGHGQWANQPLISTEQYAAGGVETVRGYLESERFGDNAWNFQGEIRSPFFSNFLGGYARERAQLVAFYDGAELYTLGTRQGRGHPPSQDLQGWGFGIRSSLFDHIQAYFFIARPRVQTFDTGNMWRYHFQVTAGF